MAPKCKPQTHLHNTKVMKKECKIKSEDSASRKAENCYNQENISGKNLNDDTN